MVVFLLEKYKITEKEKQIKICYILNIEANYKSSLLI